MEKSAFYLFVQNTGDVKEVSNTAEDFYINLNRELLLEGEWEVALAAYKSSEYNKSYYICSDIVLSSLVNTLELPFLRIIYENSSATLVARCFKANGSTDKDYSLFVQQDAMSGIEFEQFQYHTLRKKTVEETSIFQGVRET